MQKIGSSEMKRIKIKTSTWLQNSTFTSQALEVNNAIYCVPPGKVFNLKPGDTVIYNTLTMRAIKK